MIEIIPALMPHSVHHLEEQLSRIANYVPRVQLDIMDGVFVKPKTWPYLKNYQEFTKYTTEQEGLPYWNKLNFEIDLMVAHPENIIDDWINAGAERLIVHLESTKKMPEIVSQITKRFGRDEYGKRDVELGIALNIDTSTEQILTYLEDIDFVQFMGIAKIGYQNEAFDERVLDKIRQFHNAHPEVIVSIDGGVSLNTAEVLLEEGVKRLVSGSAIFGTDNVIENIQAFKRLFR